MRDGVLVSDGPPHAHTTYLHILRE
jgi:hypothetical protein